MPMSIAKELIANESTVNFYERISTELLKGIFKVSKMGKYGLASREGTLICPCIYDEIETIDNSFKVKKDKYWGIIDITGKILCPCNYSEPLQVDAKGLYYKMDDDVYYIAFEQ